MIAALLDLKMEDGHLKDDHRHLIEKWTPRVEAMLALTMVWQPRETAPKDRPIQTWDGKCQAVVQWDAALQDFALAPDDIFDADLSDRSGTQHLVDWAFTHWHDLLEPPAP